MNRWEFLLGLDRLDGPLCVDCKTGDIELQIYCGEWRREECISEIERAEKYGEDTREEFRRRIGR